MDAWKEEYSVRRGRGEVKHFLLRTRVKIKSLSVHERGWTSVLLITRLLQKPTSSFSLSNMKDPSVTAKVFQQ